MIYAASRKKTPLQKVPLQVKVIKCWINLGGCIRTFKPRKRLFFTRSLIGPRRILHQSGVNDVPLRYQMRRIFGFRREREKKNPIRDVTVLLPVGICDI